MIKRLAKCVREYRRSSLLSPIFVTLEAMMEILIPFLMAMIIDRGIYNSDKGYIAKIGAVLLAAAFLSLLFGILSGHFAAIGSAGFAKNLRHDIYENIQTFSFSNIDKFSTSSLITRLTTDVTNVQNAYQMIIRVAVRGPVMLIFALIMAFQVNHRISLIFLAAVPILGAGFAIIIKKAHPIFVRVFQIYDRLNRVVQENLRGIRVVKAYVRENHEVEKFQSVSGEIFDNFSAAEKIVAFNSPLMQFAMSACLLLLSWFGAKTIVSGSMTTGELMTLVSYTAYILMSLMLLSMVFVMIIISRASAERICAVLASESDLRNSENPDFSVMDGSISFCHVYFSYTGELDKSALKDIDFEICSGETVGILGGTGSAKTTLISLIPRLYDVTEGAVKVGGRDVRDIDIRTLRDQVTVVLQKNVLFSGTIRENLCWGDQTATDEDLARVCRLAQAEEFIRDFPQGYDTYIEQGGSNVSGGQRQRLCIARALLKDPKILILDDSTSAVDTRTDALIQKALKEEIPDTTKIIIAQRISSVEDADKIIVMDGGRISAMGTHEELLNSSTIYQEVYSSQMKGGGDDDAA